VQWNDNFSSGSAQINSDVSKKYNFRLSSTRLTEEHHLFDTMHFTKPAWVMHKDSAKSDQNTKRLSIFSISVHPDGSRIATGGLDAKIRIWSTKPILNEASEQSGKPPKSLCTLTMHGGPVLVVRWAHSGKWLASGSDDETVMIWDHDP
jgi:protein HIRA/HIR1